MHTWCAFKWLEHHGFVTHWHERRWRDKTTLLVEEAQVRGLPLLSGKADHEVLGLELLVRLRASKKFCGRVAHGDVVLDQSIWPSETPPQPGDQFRTPFVETSTKWEKADRYLTVAEAAELTGISSAELFDLYRLVRDVGCALSELYACAGFTLIDVKEEMARHKKTKEFVIIDGISLDEVGAVRDGVEYGKNPLRDWYKEEHPEWYQLLRRAQEEYPNDSGRWPPYPAVLPDALKEAHIGRYEFAADRLADVIRAYVR